MTHRLVRTAAITIALAAATVGHIAQAQVAMEVKTAGGLVRGAATTDGRIKIYRGIPYAAPPVGDRRWKPPAPVAPWTGTRDATTFGSQCVQAPVFADITFTSPASEDCLTLNVWTPATNATDRLPVMVWIHGGGFQAGAGPEPRHDGEALARKGVILVTINYRLGIFGFFSHPDLTRESGRTASGNYGLLDQVAALQWVRDHIAAFGGAPDNVTIFGESAGSFAVSALMASPLAKGLFHKAIGESGAYVTATPGPLPLLPRTATEAAGATFAEAIGAGSLAALRAKPASEILEAAAKRPWFSPNIDGDFLPEDAYAIYVAGRQHRVPLLAGWNADEVRSGVVLAKEKPTATSFAADVRKRFGSYADVVLNAYPAASDGEALESAAALASDTFIGYGTWKWIEVHAKTGQAPVYRFSFDRKIPVAPDTMVNGVRATAEDIGARHAGEIQYVFGTLDSITNVGWQPSDRALSDAMTTYWTNFARTGDPNGPGLPAWPRYDRGGQLLHLDEKIWAGPDIHRRRYEALDAFSLKK